MHTPAVAKIFYNLKAIQWSQMIKRSWINNPISISSVYVSNQKKLEKA